MVSLFKVASEVFLLVLFVVTLLLNINLFITPPEILTEYHAPFSYAVHQILFAWFNIPQWIYTFIHIGVLYGSAVYFGIIVAKNRFISNYTYLPALMFVTIFSFFNQQTYPTLVFLFLPLFIMMFNKLFEIAVYDKNLSRSLDVGLICGTLTLVYLPYWSLVVFSYITFAIVTPFYWRFWVATIVGFICPAIMALIFFGLFGQHQMMLDYLMLQQTTANLPIYLSNLQIWYRFIVLAICLIILFLFIDEHIFKVTTLMKRYRNLFNTLIVCLLAYQLVIQTWLFEMNMIILIVLSIYYSNVILRVKNELISNAVHGLMLLFVLFFQYFT